MIATIDLLGQYFRNRLSRGGRAAFLIATLCLAGTSAWSQNSRPVEGRDYKRLATSQSVENASKVEVIEFFAYWCPHCNAFEAPFNQWAKSQPSDVVVRHVPIAFNAGQVSLQRLYYVLDALGKEGELRAKVFAAIHVEHNALDTSELQADFAAKNGIDRKKYLEFYNSFAIDAKTKHASQLAEAYEIDSVPTVAVNGKYTLGGENNTIAVLNDLIAGERKNPGKAAAATPHS